jgi:hypothetical protein
VDSTIRELRRAVRGPHDWAGIEAVAQAVLHLGPREGNCGLVSPRPDSRGRYSVTYELRATSGKRTWRVHLCDRGQGPDSWTVEVDPRAAGVKPTVLRRLSRGAVERLLAAVEAGADPSSREVQAFARGLRGRARQEAS